MSTPETPKRPRGRPAGTKNPPGTVTGRPRVVAKPYRLALRIERAVYERLAAEADRAGVTVTEIVRRKIEN